MSISDWGDLMTQSVTVEELSGRSIQGGANYGSPTTYDARVNYVNKWVRDSNNHEVMSKGVVWLETNTTVATEDKLTLPDGTSPIILLVERFSDENGEHHVKITFGHDER